MSSPIGRAQSNIQPSGAILRKYVDIRAGNGLFSITKREVKTMQAYCVKCRAKREMRDARAITMKNGKPATQGVCPTCGTKMFRIGKS